MNQDSNIGLRAAEIEIPITSSPDGAKVGYIRLRIYKNQISLGDRFGNFLQRIPFNWSYPLGVFEDLFVDPDKRRRGCGRLGLRIADQALRERGVRTGFLKVGWSSDENWEEAKTWKTKFYAGTGWIPLRWKFPEPVLMAKDYACSTHVPRMSQIQRSAFAS
jgi:GNAT superfamily N-acetyltransferase